MRRSALLLSGLLIPAVGQAGEASLAGPDRVVSEVVVTAAPYAVSLETITSSVNVLGREALDVAPPAGIGDALNGLPGIRSSSYGPGSSRPIIRGLSGPRVMVLQNGVGMVDASALSPDHAVASDPSDSLRIEVLRGPSTLAYGGSGIGGVVNMIDDRVPATTARNGLEGRISLSGSTGDDGRAVATSLKSGTGPWVLSASASHRQSHDYPTPVAPVSRTLAASDGLIADPALVQKNADAETDEYGIGGSYIHDRGFVGASIKRTDSTYGVPYQQILAPIDPDAEGPVSIHLKQVRVDARAEQSLDFAGFDKVKVTIGWADYQHAEISRVDGGVGTRFLSTGAEARVELIQQERDGWQGAVGLQGLTRDFEAIGDEAFVPPVKVSEFGVFTLQRLDRGRWGIDAGLRLDRRHFDVHLTGRPDSAPASQAGIHWITEPETRSFSNVSGSLGVFYKLTDDWFTALTLSRNGRAPSEFELYADGPHPGTGGYELGNPDLGSEQVTSIEGTLRYTGDNQRLEGHLWSASYDNFIEDRRTGGLESGLPVFVSRATGARFQGAELEGSWKAWSAGDSTLSVEGDADVVRGQTDEGPPARMPPWSVTGRLIFVSPRLDAQVELRHVAKQTRLAELELPTAGHDLVNLLLTWKPTGESGLRLFVDGRNLGNAEAREHASFLKDIVTQQGRTLRAGLVWKF
jgi:iron complex outermembrane receptor protein